MHAKSDVTVGSFKEADWVLYGTFANTSKVGNASVAKTLKKRQYLPFSVNNKDGILTGHDGLSNGHPHKTVRQYKI